MKISPRPSSSEETKQKLRELILYISEKSSKDTYFGMIKLNKLILRADRLSYLRHGKPITGTAYMRLPQGFVPLHMIQVLDEMKAENEIVVKHLQMVSYIQKRVVPLRNAILDNFTAQDIELVREVIDSCSLMTASEMSEDSHGTAWKIASDRDTIPYTAFLLSDDQTASNADIEEAYALIEKHNWDVYVHA